MRDTTDGINEAAWDRAMRKAIVKIQTTERPYLITFLATGMRYPLSSFECQRLLDAYPAVSATRNRVVLFGHNTPDPKQRVVLTAATLGGGPAFTVTKE